ncbi:MAG: hypothetical protein QOC57_2347 [Ilumatobacteraceae bacterium]|jgi:hypothetical protein|nr:hypothetical protein [Ilumatobacteraceae bacterium]
MIGRNRRVRQDQPTADLSSIEFAELLDPEVADPNVADLVMFPITRQPEVGGKVALDVAVEVEDEVTVTLPPHEDEPAVSRFAGAGIDDDRLPVRSPRARRFRH